MEHKEFLDKLENGKDPAELKKPKLPPHLDPEYTGQPTTEEKLSAQKELLSDLENELKEA